MIPKDYFNSYKSYYKERDKRALIDELNGRDAEYSIWGRLHCEVAWSYW